MNKVAVTLLGFALLAAPAISPALAQDEDRAPDQADPGSEGSTAAFDGDHVRLVVDNATASDLTLVGPDRKILQAIALPGENPDHRIEEDEVHLATEQAGLRIQDEPAVPTRIGGSEEAPIRATIAEDLTVNRTQSDDQFVYRIGDGDEVLFVISAEKATLTGRELAIAGDATGMAPSASADDNRSEDDSDRTRDGGRAGREESEERRERAPSQGPDRERKRGVSQASYEIGRVSLALDGDRLRNVAVSNATLFTTLDVPGLTPANSREEPQRLRLGGENARVDVRAHEGAMLRVDAERTLEADIAPGVEIREGPQGVYLRSGSVLAVAQGEGLTVDDDRLTTDENLRLIVHGQDKIHGPVWERQAAHDGSLPVEFDGRFLGFTVNATGVQNLRLHGTPVGDIPTPKVTVDEVTRTGNQIQIEGEGFELSAVDAPAARLTVEAPGLASQVDASTTLPSGATVETSIESDKVELTVKRPAGALAAESPLEHRPAERPVETNPGPEPSLSADTGQGALGITSSDPARVDAQFEGTLDGVEGNISVTLGLTRAMLVEDTNGNDRVDVGEPAIAEQALTDGETEIVGDELVSQFALWSGNLTVRVEPGNTTAKVTYEAHDLQAPPGTLFVLETEVQAPANANLRPTDDGVVVRNGSMSARYAASGPVTVDGEEAWADRSIFVDGNDTVRMLVAYPAGDDVVHDPTLAVQSVPGQEAIARLAASPYSVAIGAVLAGALVAGTAYYKRQQRP
jgi:hypothetical protein